MSTPLMLTTPKASKLGELDQCRDKRHQDVFDQGSDDCPERCTDDDGDGKVYDVAFHDEISESL